MERSLEYTVKWKKKRQWEEVCIWCAIFCVSHGGNEKYENISVFAYICIKNTGENSKMWFHKGIEYGEGGEQG